MVPLKEGSKGNLGSLSRLFSLVVEHYTCNVKVSSSILEASSERHWCSGNMDPFQGSAEDSISSWRKWNMEYR